MNNINLKDCQFIILANGEKCLFGYTVDDPRYDPLTTEFAPGHRIITSEIQLQGSYVVRTRNNSYAILNFKEIEDKETLLKMYPGIQFVPVE